MAIPLVAAALPLLAKVGTAAKALWAGAKGAAALAKGAGAAKGAIQLGIPTIGKNVAAGAFRPAGAKLMQAATQNPAFQKGVGRAIFGDMTKQQIGMRLSGDLMFGGVAGLTTPGDIGDKLIAGTTSAIGGGLGGVALGRATQRFGDGISFAADMAGSYGGDMLGMAVGDATMRTKDKLFGGAGQTPYERLNAEQQKLLEQQIQQQTLSAVGLLPGYPSYM